MGALLGRVVLAESRSSRRLIISIYVGDRNLRGTPFYFFFSRLGENTAIYIGESVAIRDMKLQLRCIGRCIFRFFAPYDRRSHRFKIVRNIISKEIHKKNIPRAKIMYVLIQQIKQFTNIFPKSLRIRVFSLSLIWITRPFCTVRVWLRTHKLLQGGPKVSFHLFFCQQHIKIQGKTNFARILKYSKLILSVKIKLLNKFKFRHKFEFFHCVLKIVSFKC